MAACQGSEMNKRRKLLLARGMSALAAAMLCAATQPAFSQGTPNKQLPIKGDPESRGLHRNVSAYRVSGRATPWVSSPGLHTYVNDEPVLYTDSVPRQVTPPETGQQSSSGESAGPLLRTSRPQTLFQGQADYGTCIGNATGATAIVFACLGAAITHTPAGGVAGLFIGDGIGRLLLGPLACTPDPIP